MALRIDLNEPRILGKVTSDRFGLLVSQEWKKLIDPYTPKETGLLMGEIGSAVDLSVPFQIHYKATQSSNSTSEESADVKSYAIYVYENARGVKFKTGGSGRNPYATDHWDIKAEYAGQKDKLYRTLNNKLRSGQY